MCAAYFCQKAADYLGASDIHTAVAWILGLLQQTTPGSTDSPPRSKQQQQHILLVQLYRTSTLYLANGAAATRISEILEILSYIYGFFESSSQWDGRADFGHGRLAGFPLLFRRERFFLQCLFRHAIIYDHIITSNICKKFLQVYMHISHQVFLDGHVAEEECNRGGRTEQTRGYADSDTTSAALLRPLSLCLFEPHATCVYRKLCNLNKK
jgi:hypothetical protein